MILEEEWITAGCFLFVQQIWWNRWDKCFQLVNRIKWYIIRNRAPFFSLALCILIARNGPKRQIEGESPCSHPQRYVLNFESTILRLEKYLRFLVVKSVMRLTRPTSMQTHAAVLDGVDCLKSSVNNPFADSWIDTRLDDSDKNYLSPMLLLPQSFGSVIKWML